MHEIDMKPKSDEAHRETTLEQITNTNVKSSESYEECTQMTPKQ